MPTSNLISLFNSLEGTDINQCRKLIASPIYNPSAQGDQKPNLCSLLYEVLVKNRKIEVKKNKKIEIRKIEINDGKLWKKIFDKEKYDARKLSYIKSDLADLIEDFLVYKEFQKNPLQRDIYLLKSLRENNIDNNFTQTHEKLKKQIEDTPVKNSEFLLSSAKMQYEYYLFSIGKTRVLPSEFGSYDELFSYYVISKRLKSICEAISNKQQTSMKNEWLNTLDNQIVEITKQLVEKDTSTPTIIKLYFACYEMLKNKTTAYFESFKALLNSDYQILEPEEFNTLLYIGINFTNSQLSGDKRDFYLSKQFELYQFGLETRGLFVEMVLGHFTFKNIVTVASHINNFEWVNSFIENYKKYLELPYQKGDFINYCSAIMLFREKKYDKTIELLRNIKLEDLKFELDIRRMLVCCSFEEKEDELLQYQLQNFKRCIDYNKKTLGNQHDNYNNFIRFTKQINRLQNKDNITLNEIIQEFEQTQKIAEKDWLKSKLGIVDTK